MTSALEFRDDKYRNAFGLMCEDTSSSSVFNPPELYCQPHEQAPTTFDFAAPLGRAIYSRAKQLTAGTVLAYGSAHIDIKCGANYLRKASIDDIYACVHAGLSGVYARELVERSAETVREHGIVYACFVPTVSNSSKAIQADDLSSVLAELYGSLERAYIKEIVQRLEYLAEPSEDLNDPILSNGSLKQFISFIKSDRFQKPSLVLSNDGNVRAEWRRDRAHHFVAEFFPDGLVKFVTFVQSTINSKKIERVAGITSLEKLKSMMETTDAKWCFE